MIGILESILWIIRFLFGACIFSFLTVVADRLPREESVVSGRSHCTQCGRILTGWELIPCVSYWLYMENVRDVEQGFHEDVCLEKSQAGLHL